jgi:phenylalanyl-tRNA synthetase alpha chain
MNIEEIKKSIDTDLEHITKQNELNDIKSKYLGKEGVITLLQSKIREIPNEEKKEYGIKVNEIRTYFNNLFEEVKTRIETEEVNRKLEKEAIDITLPSEEIITGSLHPFNRIIEEVEDIFVSMGYDVVDGPELETDEYCFERLNLPKGHPARDMQDTFFIEQNPDVLLRTHTSSVQIRHMEENQPPIRILSPGRVFRNEAISSRSHCIFHQIEGLYIDENVSFADLKQTLQFFTTELFGKSKIRMRPSYFPFTEPSAEVDVYWGLNSETDYRITKGTGWLEIMGCGMVDPAVLKNVNIDADKYSGYAFGMGIERIVMLLYQLGDIRMFFENDKRMLEQFGHL